MNKNIRKHLKTDYEDLEIKPSANLWDRIESGLDVEVKTVKKPLFIWWKYAAVVVLLFSLGGLLYFNSDENLKHNPKIGSEELSENISNSLADAENSDVFTETLNTENSGIKIKTKNSEIKQLKKIANTQNPVLEAIPKVADNISEIDIKTEQAVKVHEIPESPQIFITEKAEDKTVKYITANDLIFQRKYSNEKKEGSHENVKRLGIIKINKINISPELITAFHSNTDNE